MALCARRASPIVATRQRFVRARGVGEAGQRPRSDPHATISRPRRKSRMPRSLRFVPENALVEVTTRTLQGRLLLRPSPELNDLVLGVIGKAQDRYRMVIHAFVVTSTHAHYILSPTSAEQLARFMQFVDANIAKEAGRLHLWPERLWSRRYRSIVIADDNAALARLRYVLAHGAKEGLVGGGPGSWPGPHCIAALSSGQLLRGTWFDRGAEYKARQRGESVLAMQFATTFDVNLTPLPCLRHLTQSQRQAEIRHMVREIEAQAEAENLAKGRTPMGVAAILAQDPHSRPASTDRSPAPFVHASDKQTALEFRAKYRVYVDAFRSGAWRLKARAADFAEMFPLWSFPPALPFNAPA